MGVPTYSPCSGRDLADRGHLREAGEYAVISGRINDLAWDGDSQRIIAVGDGKTRYGHCFTADGGNSVGEISGHSGPVNSVSIRQQRPLRAATGSDDSSVGFYHGAPFKFNTSIRAQHPGFVYGVAFSPDGKHLVSVGANRSVFLCDGKSGEAKGDMGERDYRGSIFAVSWASDSRKLVTASADQSVRIVDVETQKVVQTWSLGAGEGVVSIPHQQVGVVWPAGRSDGMIISLGLNGDLSYLVEGSPTPARIVQGHQKSITAVCASEDASGTGQTLWTGSYDGRVCEWNLADGSGQNVLGEGHSNYIVGLAKSSELPKEIYSVAWDDTLRTIDHSSKQYGSQVTCLAKQPKAMASVGYSSVAVMMADAVEVYRDGTEKLCEIPVRITPLALATMQSSQKETVIAAGGDDRVVRLYLFNLGSSSLTFAKELTPMSAPVSALTFSPDRQYLAVGLSTGKILVYDTAKYEVVIDRWSAHTARVTMIAWNKESTHAVSGGLDTSLFVWSVESPGKRVKIINAHKDGVNGVLWMTSDDKVVSVGADAAIKLWKYKP